PDQRRRSHHEQQMLQHVDAKEQLGERLDGRSQRQEDERQPSGKRGKPPGVPAPRVFAAQRQPTAQIDAGCQTERQQEPWSRRPRAQEGVNERTHGCFVVRATRCAGGCESPRGFRLAMKSTSAVISLGLICAPYAGMLPPPGVPLLTWSMSWSGV